MSAANKSTRGRKKTLTDSGRKRNKLEAQATYNKAKVYIGNEYGRWMHIKNILGVHKHCEVAKLLLDRYHSIEENIEIIEKRRKVDKAVPPTSKSKAITSTPGPQAPIFLYMSDVSKIATSDSDQNAIESDACISGVEMLSEVTKQKSGSYKDSSTSFINILDESDGCIPSVDVLPEVLKQKTGSYKDSSFINPLEITIDVTESDTSDEDTEDKDYEPSFNITLSESVVGKCIVDLEEEDEILDEELEINVDHGPSVCQILTDNEAEDLFTDHPCLSFYSQLLRLAKTSVPKHCTTLNCSLPVNIVKNIVGSAVYMKWVCAAGHVVHKWCSQPVLNRGVHSGDIMVASSIVLSGNNFQKISLFADFLKLPILSKSSFFKIQSNYIIPTVDEYWLDHQNSTLDEFRDEEIVVLGDGRMDSPGHSSQFCSYTFMENKSKKILCIVTMDKRETDKKSTQLEKACFVKGLKFLLENNMKIVEVVTDAHVQVAAIMKKEYPNIKHSWDVWHGTKNLGKKIVKAGQNKECKQLLDWVKDVVNHYWYTAQTANTKEEFVGMWIGLLHHVVDVHEWILPFSLTSKCEHGPLSSERDKGWLVMDSPPHKALRRIVLDKRLLNNISHYLNCRSTAELENFQSLILMYASKRHSYRPPTYRCRNLLAALDHNMHSDRPVLTNRDGTIRYHRTFQKKSCRWSVKPCKTEKEYGYVTTIVEKIILKRLHDNVGMKKGVVVEQDDPRRISAHLAPVPPPPTREIVRDQRSRFTSSI